MTASKVHLVVLIHGLWGNPSHMSVARDELEAAWEGIRTRHDISGPSEDPSITTGGVKDNKELVVMVAGGMTSTLTYDGVDVCASRVAWEVDQKLAQLEQEGKDVVEFSVTGYSLGGLVARYLVGLLHSRTPSFFDKHHPVSFSTISSPHYGLPRYNTALSTVLCWLGARIMSRSGEQLYVVDRYSDEDPRPLLEIMADPHGIFYQGLEQFDRLLIYASAVNDNSVPYPTAAIETVDHFAQWDELGISVDADEAGIIRSWSKADEGVKPLKKSLSTYIGTLPPVLRFRFPFNYIILILFPVMLPIIILLILFRQSLDTRRSKRRLQQLAQTSSSGSQRQVASVSGISIEGLRQMIRRVERRLESDLIESAESSSVTTHTKGSVDLQEATIKIKLKDSQLRMALWLNSLPLQKFLTWWPEISNAHATAIVRDSHLFPVHERGRGLIKLWAGGVLGQKTVTSI